MKFVIDQRLKHRIIGATVIAALAAIFLPAMMKQSNYRFDQSTSVSIHLPPKPETPNVALKNEKTMFDAANQVTRLELPKVQENAQLPPDIRAQRLNSRDNEPQLAKPEFISRPALHSVELAAASKPIKTTVARVTQKKIIDKPQAIKIKENKVQNIAVKSIQKELYAVQLASFAQQSNAQSLVDRLRKEGYQATYSKASSKSGSLYKVLIGAKHREEAVSLQKQLSSKLQLNGFIVKTGVS